LESEETTKENKIMKKSFNYITNGLGIASLMCGVYWIYKGGEFIEIILPIIIGIGIIGSGYLGSEEKNTDPN